LTVPRATVLAAVISAAATYLAATYLGTTHHGDLGKLAAATAPTISMDKQATGLRQVQEQDDYSGTVKNLQKNQVVWMFNQQLIHTNDPKALPSAIYADAGPCDVTGNRWSCDGITVGEPAGNPNAPGTYRVWVAVVDLPTAFRLVQSLQNAKDSGHIPDHPDPPNVGAIDHMDVVRR
jgi:hypothetical protein